MAVEVISGVFDPRNYKVAQCDIYFKLTLEEVQELWLKAYS